jgi:hypothetical protein
LRDATLVGTGLSVGRVDLLQEFSEPGWIYQNYVDQKKGRKGKKKNEKIH